MDETKKTSEETTKATSVDESDFADEAKPVPAPAPVEEPKKEDKKEENKINLHSQEEPEPAPAEAEKKEKEPTSYSYVDPKLQGIENARLNFFQSYKKENIIKWILTAVILAVIVAGWLIPTFVNSIDSTVGFYITLGVVVVAVICLGVYSYFYKKRMDVSMKAYFAKYYELTNDYVFGDEVSDLRGAVDDKLDPEVFKASGLYKDVAKVGSRETIHFTYKEKDCLLSDCAGQIKGDKALQTVFVGKLLVVPNNYSGTDVIIYLKGNKRALPPTTLDQYDVIEDSHTMVVYGQSTGKRVLTKTVRNALSKIRTNDTLVDLAISIKPGKTYYAFGYDDNLMVLPLEKAFNPTPTEELGADMKLVLNLVDAFEAHPEDK